MPRRAAREIDGADGTDLLGLRLERGLHLADVQRSGGPTISYLASVERGVQRAGEWTLYALARVYGLPAEEVRRAYSVTRQRLADTKT